MSAKKSVLILSLIFLVSGICGKAFARPIYVDANAPGPVYDGSSWANAYKYLQDALSAAVSGDEIWVADGVYKPDRNSVHPNGTGERMASFKLISGVKIYGGYAGYGVLDPDARDVKKYETILSGDIGVIGSNGDNSYHVVRAGGTNETAVLDGFTITAGNANSDWSNGGGIYNTSSGSPTISNCTFTGNSADYDGGGIYNGGIYGSNDSGSPIITNCIFTGNSASSGGGMYSSGNGNPTIRNCIFTGNSANSGGGMSNSGTSTITNCTFTGNSTRPGGSGGGMSSSGSPKITNCIFTGNSANSGGGMSGSGTITNCTFTGNSATYYGGYAGGWPATVMNCILWGNNGGQISGAASVTYSDIEGGWEGTGNIDADPLLKADGYHLMTPCSPCIDAGNPCVTETNETDIDGEPRIMDGDRDGFLTVDMGADELRGPDREPDHIVVDDFESYTNSFPKRIWDPNGWKKGGGGKVGYPYPNYAELTIVHGCGQSMPFDYNNLNPPYDSNANRTFDTPQDWTANGVKELSLWLRGWPAPVGSFTRSASPPYTYTMTASGDGIPVGDIGPYDELRDEFHYAYIPITGDCNIVVKVKSITNTHAWAKAGLMIRDSLAADSNNVMVCITPGNGVRFQHRGVAGGPSTEDFSVADINAPCWLRLERHNNPYCGYLYSAWYSSCGPSGEPNNWTGWPDSVQVNMANDPDVYIGLALTAGKDCETCEAVFSDVTVVAYDGYGNPVTLPSPWTSHKDIGIKSNTAAPLYVTLQDSSAKTATVTHPDPNIALACTWREWCIPLAGFSDVNLAAIKKITIGVGDRISHQGAGTLFFDDIRLYRRCTSELRAAGDFTCDCVVDYRDLKIMTDEWLSTRCLRTDLYKDDNVNFKDFAILAENWLEQL